MGERDFCLRAYGFNDSFSGKAMDASTLWLGQPLAEWFSARGFHPQDCGGLDNAGDIQSFPLFPICQPEDLDAAFITWLFAAQPENRPDFVRRWRESARLSAQEAGSQVNLRRLYARRAELRRACLLPLLKNFRWSVFFQLDLESTARAFAATNETLPDLPFDPQDDPMQPLHDQMFRSAVLRHRGDPGWERFEASAFARLREMIAREAQHAPASPRRNVLEDQIVWARSPLRLDLAGGWTDTPPYCIEYGGNVLNLAVDINGQPLRSRCLPNFASGRN